MTVAFTPNGWADYLYWQEADQHIREKINTLLSDIARNPFTGLGKPEPFRGNLSGYWSRRITGEHRLVYRVGGAADVPTIMIIHARFHYQ